MEVQAVIVIGIVAIAVAYAAVTFLRKTKAFSPKGECAEDCGCSSKTKTPKAAH